MPDDKVKKGNFRSLAINLVVTFFVLMLVILISSLGLDVYSNFTVQQQFIINQEQLIAQEAANAVTNFIQEKFSILQTAARLSNLSNDFTSDQQKLILDKLLGAQPAFRQLFFIDPQGNVVSTTSRLSDQMRHIFSKDETDTIISQTQKGNVYISPIIIDELNNEPLVIMAVPVSTILGDFQGVLASEVNLKFIWDLVGSMKIGSGGQAYVVDKKGNLIASGDISRVLARENLNSISEVHAFVNNQKPVSGPRINASKGILGTDVIATYIPLETPDWAVIIELPLREAYDSIIQIAVRAVIILLFSLTLTTLAGLYLSRAITKPIINLRNAAFQISEGKLDTAIDIHSGDEIEQLAHTFNEMTTKLKQSYTILEQKVEERTKELEEAKKQQESVNVDLEKKVSVRTGELEALKNNLEKSVAERTAQLNVKLIELEQMNKAMVGRELRMAEMKRELEKLKGTDNYPPTPEEVMASIDKKSSSS